MMTKMPNPSWASQLAALLGPSRAQSTLTLSALGQITREGMGSLALPSEQTVCGRDGEGQDHQDKHQGSGRGQ